MVILVVVMFKAMINLSQERKVEASLAGAAAQDGGQAVTATGMDPQRGWAPSPGSWERPGVRP